MVRMVADERDVKIGLMCRQLRRVLNLKQGELGALWGVTQEAVCQREKGKIKIPTRDLYQLARLGGVKVEDLNSGVGEFFIGKYYD